MKVNLDDPNLTAFALGELSADDHAKMAEAIADSPEAQNYVAETQQFARLLRAEYEGDRQMPTDVTPASRARPSDAARMEAQRRSSARYQWGSLAAAVAIFTVIAAVALSTLRRETSLVPERKRAAAKQPAEETTIEMEAPPPPPPVLALKRPTPGSPGEVEQFGSAERSAPGKPPALASNSYSAGASRPKQMRSFKAGALEPEAQPPSRYRDDFNTATYDHVDENPFLPATTNPLSTFSIDVDTASYSNVRRFINSGSLPPKDAVRIEEMVNYFTYDYREPEAEKPFSIALDATSCPWEPSHRLLRIGLKGREVANEKRPASNLVFLLDVSGSMMPAERLPLVKQAMRLLVEKLGENDRVAIVVYAGGSGLALN
ncbi:MAG TPA: von Willebrand factor type A domain-containing protein, partial [Chthoniobacterales bacterium]